MPAVWNPQANTIFLQAMDRPATERQAFVRQTCGGDVALQEQVLTLLAAGERAGSFLESPPTAVADLADTARETAADAPSLDFLFPSQRPDGLGRLGHYEVLAVVGSGAFGMVLKAFDDQLHRMVAIKVLNPSLAASATARKRFVREARAAAAINHENVVAIHAVEETGPVPYLVMECVAGVALEDRLKECGPLGLKEILRIGLQIAAGLAAAHAQGLVHRDIKPANILLENSVERVKITDFGLARAANDATITHAGVVAGTPQYMSPEQAQGLALDARSDLFSLGSVLYTMCTGRSPFRAETTIDAIRRVCDDTPRPIREINPKIPEWLVEIINRLLAKQPTERFQTAHEVADLFDHYLAQVQQPPVVGQASRLPMVPMAGQRPSPRTRHWTIPAAALVLLVFGISLTEATGVTHVSATVIHIFTPSGTLIVESDDSAVKVTVEGDGGLTVAGAGLEEIRLRPGSYKVHAETGGASVPLERELVSIAKNSREIVKVKLDASPPRPAAKAEAGAFVLLASGKEQKFDTLAVAVQSAGDGDTIEVRGNGPFVSPPIKIATRALTIRAADSFVPVLRLRRDERLPRSAALFESQGLLVLEGLDLQLIGFDVRDDVRCLNCLGASRAYVANCRLLANPRAKAIFATHNARLDIRNSQSIAALILSHAARFHAENNLIASPQTGLEITDGLLRLDHNTLVGKLLFAIRDDIANDDVNQLARRIQCESMENVFDARGLLLSYAPWSGPRGQPKGQEAPPSERLLTALEKRATWLDSGNGYRADVPFLGLFINPSTSVALTTLSDWHRFWGITEQTRNIQGIYRFEGGDVFMKVTEAPDDVKPEDFRLEPDSAGYRAGKGGKDLGADIELVGPGAAYERWKQTPEYQQWLNEMGQ